MSQRSKPDVAARRMCRAIIAASLGVLGGTAIAQPGYVTSPSGNPVVSGYGLCVRSGFWAPELAAAPCDTVAVASAPPPAPPVAVAPAPEPAPIARAEPAPLAVAPIPEPRPVLQKITLSADVLFDFGKAELKDSGKSKLDEIAAGMKGANVDEIIAMGHADRIASDDFNQKLSEQRAEAVKVYLIGTGVPADKVRAEGKGEAQPVTGEDCKKFGAERASNKKLVSCLQPDRRVEIEVLGTRQVAGTPAQPGAGATGGAGSTSGSGR